jgi:hypothetical protein
MSMVGKDFFRRCLSPLQARVRPAWFYAGNDDECRLSRGAEFNRSNAAIAAWMAQVI